MFRREEGLQALDEWPRCSGLCACGAIVKNVLQPGCGSQLCAPASKSFSTKSDDLKIIVLEELLKGSKLKWVQSAEGGGEQIIQLFSQAGQYSVLWCGHVRYYHVTKLQKSTVGLIWGTDYDKNGQSSKGWDILSFISNMCRRTCQDPKSTPFNCKILMPRSGNRCLSLQKVSRSR